jgi:alkanesulfonate monooxygenase SsuD/methylene tetrahydromethanopterin reductase-like flavin-dependent oxidoreductase (luciferase family)
VLDPRAALARLRDVAAMCDRAGVDTVWVHDRVGGSDTVRLDTLVALRLAAAETSRVRVGALVDPAQRPLAQLLPAASAIDVATGGRLELGFTGGGAGSAADLPIAATRAALKETSPQPGGPRIGVESHGLRDTALAAATADDVILPSWPRERTERALFEIREACGGAGRDPASLGVGLVLPVSIGRTSAEARARAYADPTFGAFGDPAAVGIVGSLENGQRRVLELAHAGVTDIRCIVPATPDVHDVIAQLTSMVVGTTARLTAGAPSSPAPPPPPGWGGRSRAP